MATSGGFWAKSKTTGQRVHITKGGEVYGKKHAGISPADVVPVAGSKNAPKDEPPPRELTIPMEFSAQLSAGSGGRGYRKEMDVSEVRLKLWEGSGGKRVYANGYVQYGTRAQRGWYDLGHFEKDDDSNIVSRPVRYGTEFVRGNMPAAAFGQLEQAAQRMLR